MEDDESFIDAVLEDCRDKMTKAVAHAQGELSAIRTGRAAPALVEKLRVEYYGSEVPLQQLAGIQSPEAKTLLITPYDKGAIKAIEKPYRDRLIAEKKRSLDPKLLALLDVPKEKLSPADAEPAVNDLDGAFLYDLGDLERAALAGRAVREAAWAEAWRILDAELSAFAERRASRRAAPAVVALRRHVEMLRREALDEAGGDAEAATRLLANRLLHDPSEVLRELAGASPGEIAAIEDLLRRLFRLSAEGEERTE